MAKYVFLGRVSTTSQGESRNGLESQRAEVDRWAKFKGHEIVAYFEEVASGSLPLTERPVLRAALAMAKKHKTKVVTSKLDRISRNAGIIRSLTEETQQVFSIELGDEPDEFVRHIFSGLAEKERKMIGERTKAGLAAAKARGVRLGNPTTLNEGGKRGRETQAAIADAWVNNFKDTIMLHKSQGLNFSQIAQKLNGMGSRTARGCEWTCGAVSRIYHR